MSEAPMDISVKSERSSSGKKEKGGGGGGGGGGQSRNQGKRTGRARVQFDDPSRVARAAKAQITSRSIQQSDVPFLRHLPQYEGNTSISGGSGLGTGQVHPAIQALGVKYAKGVITGGHSRCLAFVNAMEEVFGDFVMTVGATSPETDSFGLDCQEAELGIFAIILTTLDSALFVVREQDMNNAQQIHRELSKLLNRCVQFVVECRPLSVSMGNFVRYLKEQIAHLPLVLSLPEARKLILEAIDLFREKRLLLPVKEIAAIGSKLIGHGEKIVVYAYSEVVLNLLKQARNLGTDFLVIVIDSRPLYEGRKMAKALDEAGINTDYGLVNGASYLIHSATKVILGAHSIMADGSVTSRIGTASVALLANSMHVPILVACEAAKFSDRVQLDSFAFNELGDPLQLLPSPCERSADASLLQMRDKLPSNLRMINMLYDVTPAAYVQAAICEVGIIPTTSALVIYHEMSNYTTSY